jgi:putative acetyltransferase
VFVLGHPEYYPRFGFRPAGALGMDAPYPIPERHADAWMVQALRPGLLGQVRGTVRCADTLNDPRHWRE